jgi:predicted lipoprotein
VVRLLAGREARQFSKERWIAMISKVQVERFSLTSSRSFDEVLAAINDAVGHPDMAEFWRSARQARTVGELENTIRKALEKRADVVCAV